MSYIHHVYCNLQSAEYTVHPRQILFQFIFKVRNSNPLFTVCHQALETSSLGALHCAITQFC